MERAKFLQLIRKSENHVVYFALGETADHEPALLLHQHKQGKALLNDLRHETIGKRWVYGTVQVESAEGHDLAKFTVNKETGWAQRLLLRALKGTRYKRIEISPQSGVEEELDTSDSDA